MITVRNITHNIDEIIRFSRFHEWHPGKMPSFIGASLTLILADKFIANLSMLIAAYLLMVLFLAASYMLNNLADTRQDISAGKRMGLDDWSKNARTTIVMITFLSGMIASVLLIPIKAFWGVFLCYGLCWIYSEPPRLKEHIILGPLIAAFAQIPAPALLLAYVWGSFPATTIIWIATSFLYGLRMLFLHQWLDHDNDVRSGVKTTAVILGRESIMIMVRLTFILEIVFIFLLLISLVNIGLPIILLTTLLWPIFIFFYRSWNGVSVRLDTYEYIPLADIHESILPFIVAVAVAIQCKGSMIIIIPFVVLLFLRRHYDRLILPLFLEPISNE